MAAYAAPWADVFAALARSEDREADRGARLESLARSEAEITTALKGPMSNVERALLVADRKDIRARLAMQSQGRV